MVNDASVKKRSAQAGLPGSLKPCAERPWLVMMHTTRHPTADLHYISSVWICEVPNMQLSNTCNILFLYVHQAYKCKTVSTCVLS